jgi:phosphoribosylcarboxyaminoimidazole (NCAIR) mutase
LPAGLQDGDRLPYILFDPTDKQEEGHDERISAEEIANKYPTATRRLTEVFQVIRSHAESCGIVFADTKFEGSADVLGDEVGTPDSSRFYDLREWLESRKVAEGRKPPQPLDKQLVRQEGIRLGINKLDPKKPEDVKTVHSMVISRSIIDKTTKIYRYIFWRLTGMTIEAYLRVKMGVAVEPRQQKIAVVFGSMSDIKDDVRTVLANAKSWFARMDVHVMSCHRNAEETRTFAREEACKYDAVICAGGEAFHLPGDIDAFAVANGKDVPVIGVAFGESGSEGFEAARLSIGRIPGKPVVMDEITGKVYAGTEGLSAAIDRLAVGELPPQKLRTQKPVQMNLSV